MSITIRINPDLEQRLREKAARAGIGLDSMIEEVLENWSESPTPDAGFDKSRETVLLQKINRTGFSDSFWSEYKALIKKRQEEAISEEALARLLEMSDQLEKANVRRLKYAVELATLRKVPVKEVIQKLGIPLGGHA